ncbi:hypothetical protein MHTCC0001_13090 [Flavobacteriaceae bacterium MHTCC 0001]
MKSLIIKTVLILSLVFSLFNCSNDDSDMQSTPCAQGFSGANCENVDLLAKTWKVEKIITNNGLTSTMTNNSYTIVFNEDNTLKLKLDINNCSGDYTITDKTIAILPLACTKAVGDSAFAIALSDILPTVKTITVKDDTVTLLAENNNGIIIK